MKKFNIFLFSSILSTSIMCMNPRTPTIDPCIPIILKKRAEYYAAETREVRDQIFDEIKECAAAAAGATMEPYITYFLRANGKTVQQFHRELYHQEPTAEQIQNWQDNWMITGFRNCSVEISIAHF